MAWIAETMTHGRLSSEGPSEPVVGPLPHNHCQLCGTNEDVYCRQGYRVPICLACLGLTIPLRDELRRDHTMAAQANRILFSEAAWDEVEKKAMTPWANHQWVWQHMALVLVKNEANPL